MPDVRHPIANGSEMEYRVNIDLANATKAELASVIDGKDDRVLNRVGAFSSLFLLDLGRYSEPVLVLKTEEPGSKQILAFQYDQIESVCIDMINHLINDCVVMGAEPLAVQDLVVCGKLEKSTVNGVVSAVAAACQAQGCALTGGETTEQPDILPANTYILGSSIVGVVERSKIIDGSKIRPGDVVVALGSSGPHTNGYTLIRDLLKRNPSLVEEPVGSRSFIDAVLEPHRCYYKSIKGLFDHHLVGLAHITGGGIRENLNRILPANVDARIDLQLYQPPPVFKAIRDAANASVDLMLRTFNLGVGLSVVCRSDLAGSVVEHLTVLGERAYVIGEIVNGSGRVDCYGTLSLGA
jgi:phosphoribosylformylglycinamidine cyclo-ligase